MKEDRFLNVPGEIPILTNDETNQLKGGFKKIKTNPSVRMDSGDNNENCHGHSGSMGGDGGMGGGGSEDTNLNCKFSCKCNN